MFVEGWGTRRRLEVGCAGGSAVLVDVVDCEEEVWLVRSVGRDGGLLLFGHSAAPHCRRVNATGYVVDHVRLGDGKGAGWHRREVGEVDPDRWGRAVMLPRNDNRDGDSDGEKQEK